MAGEIDQAFLPDTVDCAVHQIIEEMSLRERVMLAHFDDWTASVLSKLLVEYLRLRLTEFCANQGLLKDCEIKTGQAGVDQGQAATITVDEIWKNVRATHRLRVEK